MRGEKMKAVDGEERQRRRWSRPDCYHKQIDVRLKGRGQEIDWQQQRSEWEMIVF